MGGECASHGTSISCNLGNIMAALWILQAALGIFSISCAFFLRQQKSDGTWWDHRAQEAGVTFEVQCPGEFLYAFTSWASAVSRLHLSTAPQWRRLRPHLSGRLHCSYWLQETLTALGAHKHTVDTCLYRLNFAVLNHIHANSVHLQLSTLVPDRFTCCAAMALICPSSDTTAATRLRSELRSERSRAAGTWQLRSTLCKCGSSYFQAASTTPYGTNTHAQHLDLLWPARCKNTHSLRSKSVWIVWMRLLSTCRTVGVIFKFYHIIEYWHCRLHILPRPTTATSRLTQAPHHPAFQLPAPSHSAAPQWRDRWWKWWDGGFV